MFNYSKRMHKWFSSLKWDELRSGHLGAPYHKGPIEDEVKLDINSKRVLDLGATIPKENSGWDENF